MRPPPCFTNAGEYVVWYRVTNPNYEDFVHAAKVTISKHPVTLTSGTKTDFVYDGVAHIYPHIEVSGLGFVVGEGVITSNLATVTEVAQGEVANTFDYVPLDGTDLGNYELTIVTGRIAVVAASIPIGPNGAVTAVGYTNVYDGVAHGVAVSVAGLLTVPTVQYRAGEAEDWVDASPVYSNVCDTQVWYRISAPNYAPVVGTVGVKIMPRPITLTAPTKSKTYDGTPLTFDAGDVVVGGDGYVPGEAFTLSGFASITEVGKIDASYMVADGAARMDNYAITRVAGTLTVTRRSVSLASKSATKVYDGTPLTAHEVTIGGSGFADGEGATYVFTGSQTAVGTSENTFTYTLDGNTKAGNYEITTVNGTLTVTKANIGGGEGGGDEPGDGGVSDGGLSKFDTTFVYDGEGHTIDTNALVVAFGTAMIGESAVEYAAGGSQFTATVSDAMNCVPPCFTNAGEYVIWYRVTNPNYEDFTHAAKVTISKRPVTLTSGTKTDFVYDGQPHAFPHFIKSGHDFVEGEGIIASNWATVTTVAEGEVVNTFDYVAQEGTDLANYEIAVVAGRIAVVAAPIPIGPGGTVTVVGYTNVYDGAAHGVAVSANGLLTVPTVQYRAGEADAWMDVSPTFSNVCDTQVWYRISAPNYAPVVGTVGVRITPRPITLTAPTKSKTYDGTPLTFGAGDVVVGGDGYAPGEAFTLSGFASITEVGKVDASYTVADGTARIDNYAITRVAGTLTVTKRPVTLTSKSATKVYDGTTLTAHEVAVGGDGFADGEGATYAFTGSQTAVGTIENTFTYTLNERTVAGNYEITTANGTLTVTKANIGGEDGDEPGDGEIPDGGFSKFDTTFVYDGEGHTVDTNTLVTAFGTAMIGESVVEYAAGGTQFTATVSDAMNCVPPCFTNAGEYVVWYRVTNPNYEDFVHAAKVTISKRPVTLTSGTKLDFVYDGQPHAFPHFIKSGHDFVEGEGIEASNWATVTRVDEGEVDNTFDYVAQEGTDLANYAVTVVTGRIAVVAAPIPVGPAGIVTAVGYTNVYDGAAHGVAVSASGLLTAPTIQYRVGETDTWMDASPTFGDVCDTQVWYRISAPNYAPVVGTVGIRITPRPITLTAPTKSKTYDGTPLTFDAGDVAVGGDGYAPGEAFTLSGFASITEVGKVDASYVVADGTARVDNYAITCVAGTLTVTQSATEITVTAKNGSWVYDGQPHTLHEYDATNRDVLQPGDELAVAFDTASVVTTPIDGAAGDGRVENRIVGVRVMRGDLDVSANYTLAFYPGTLTVTRRPVTLTSKSDAKVYDGTPLTAHEATVGGDGFVGGDGVTYTFTGSQTVKGMSKNTFAYVFKDGTNAAFYDITKVEGDLEVMAADIAQGDETDWQIVLGPALTYTGSEQVQTLVSATYRGLPLDYVVTGNAQIDAGTYQMTLTGQGNFTGEKTVDWSISPKSLTLTAGGGSKIYDGTALTVGTVTTEGFVAGEGADFTCTGSQKDVGSSANAVTEINWNVNTKGSNYVVTKFLGMLTVTPRPVTLTSKSATKVYDATPLTAHEMTVGGDGFVDGEGVTYVFTGSQTAVGTSENTFTYTLNEHTAAGNYEITTVNGTLTVTKASIGGDDGDEPGDGSVPDGGLSKFDAEFVYDGEGHTVDTNAFVAAFGAAMIGESVVEYATGGSQFTATVSDTMNCVPPCFTNAGEYVVWYRVTNPNYENFVHAAKVTVTPRPVTLTSGTKLDFVYGGVVHSYPYIEVSGHDFVAGEGIEASKWATVTTVAEGEVPNTFDYAPLEGTDLANYAVTVVTGRIAVVAASIPVGPGGVITTVGYTNVYDGVVHGIAVSANGLLTAPTVQYRAGEADAWAEVSPTFSDVCDTQVWYRISAPNYVPVVGTVGIKIMPRAATVTSKNLTKPYDGTPLALTAVDITVSGIVDGESLEYSDFASRIEVGQTSATFCYAAGANTSLSNYEITPVYGLLTVTKAVIGGGGEEPGSSEIPEGGVSKFDTTHEYDGMGHTIDTNALVAAFGAAMIGESVVEYAAGGSQFTATVSDAMNCVPPCFTNAGEYIVWYKVTNPNYEDFIHQSKMTITPRDIAKAMIAPIPDVTFANRPATPVPTVTDQTPSIIKASDYTVSYRDNDRPGTATVTLTGMGNYRGTKSATFVIKPVPVLYAALRGTLAWKLNTGTGCYTAQLKLTCTNGFDQGISELRFVYQDRRDGAKITSGLWDSSARAYRPTTFLDGTAYRFVELDAARITGQDVTALYGVQDVTQAVGTVPAAECAIELFVGNLSSPISDIGYVMWKSNGTDCALPVSAAGASQGMAVGEAMLKAVRMAASVPLPGAPLSLSALNTLLALGVVVDPASNPYCRLTDFTVSATDLVGRIEVGKESNGTETKGVLGTNARVILLGAKTLADGFTEVGRVSVDDGGTFRFTPGDKGCRFFRVRIEIENVVE